MVIVAVLVALLGLPVLVWPPTAGAGVARGDAGKVDPPGAEGTVELVLFWGEGCPHCEAERRFLADLADRHPTLVVHDYEVFHDAGNRELFRELARSAGVDARAVPTTFVGDRVLVGFDETVASTIEATVAALAAGEETSGTGRRTVDVPFVGAVDVGDRSLVVSTVVIGFVDGINPCSLWVLSILLAVVLHSGSRGRVFVVGSVFLVVTSSMYGLYIAGAYSALSYAAYLSWIRRGVAVVAGTLGVFQLRDALSARGGSTVGVTAARRPDLLRRMRALATTDRSLVGVLGATAALAVGVSLLETPCTLGLPVLWTDLLAEADVPAAGAATLFVLYLAAFLVDELAVFAVAVVTMRAIRLQERHGRDLKAVSGVVMVTLAVAMVATPEAMDSATGAGVVFAVAAAVAATAVAALHRRGAARAGV